jgi:2-phospho-L-lactate/phosphoenolpyruvate guanylyltransferase
MRTAAILPIKGLTDAKTRLAGALGSGSRQALAQAMFVDVLAALRRVPELDAIVVVTSDERALGAARVGGVVAVDDAGAVGHSAAALVGIAHARAEGAERVLLVPGDTPLLDPAEVSRLLRATADGPGVAVVPDRAGTGTNALVLAPPDAIEPSFGPGSRDRHVAAARAAGTRCRVVSVPTLLHDVDTAEDLADLAAVLSERRGSAPMTRGALNQLGRSRASGRSSGARPPRERRPAADNVRVIGAPR